MSVDTTRIASLEAEQRSTRADQIKWTDKAAARIAELEADLTKWKIALEDTIKGMRIDQKAAVLAEREACERLLPSLMPLKTNRRDDNYAGGWIDAVEAYRAAIRARPAP